MPGCDERSPAAGWAAVPPSLHALQGPGSLSTWQGTTSQLADMGTTKPGEQMQPGNSYKSDLIPVQSYLLFPSK